MEVFFILFVLFILLSIVKSEMDRRKREALRKADAARQQEEFEEPRFTVPEPSVSPVMDMDDYHGEDVQRTTKAAVKEEKKDTGKELDFDPEKMIIYSEILKPKF